MRERQKKNEELVRSILGESYLHLRVDKIYMEEDLISGQASVRCELHHEASGQPLIIAGNGVGFLDAFFHAVRDRLAVEFSSLDSIELASFDISADLTTRGKPFGADAVGEVVLEVRNSEGWLFAFSARSRSITASAAEAVLRAAAYFVNSERAYITIYKAAQDARERRRADLVEHYVQQLSELVRNTSYTKVIEEIRNEVEAAAAKPGTAG